MRIWLIYKTNKCKINMKLNAVQQQLCENLRFETKNEMSVVRWTISVRSILQLNVKWTIWQTEWVNNGMNIWIRCMFVWVLWMPPVSGFCMCEWAECHLFVASSCETEHVAPNAGPALSPWRHLFVKHIQRARALLQIHNHTKIPQLLMKWIFNKK